MELTEQKTRDTKEENTGRRQDNTSTINKPDDRSNGDFEEGIRTNTYANKKILINQREPCKMLCLNAQGLMNEYTRWKVDALKEYVSTNNIILMNFTETWLKKKYRMKKFQTLQPSDV